MEEKICPDFYTYLVNRCGVIAAYCSILDTELLSTPPPLGGT